MKAAAVAVWVQGKGGEVAVSPFPPQQWLERRKDPLDDDAIAFSCRMDAVYLVERGRACHPVEEKWNQHQAVLFR